MTNFLLKNHYTWTGISPQKQKLRGEIQAYSLKQARINLMHKGIIPILITKKPFPFFNKKISALDIALFFRQLATLISAGIPIVQSCEIILQSQDKIHFRQIINSIKSEIEAGKNLFTGLCQYPCYFDPLTCQLVKIGEQTGALDIMLQRIAMHKEKSLALKKQVKQALFYPCLIFIIAILASIIMLVFVVPQFAQLFKNMNGNLPAFTQFVLELSNFICKHFLFLIVLSLTFILFLYQFNKHPRFRIYSDFLKIKIPIIKQIITKTTLARFARTLATTFTAGIPIIEALNMVADSCGNYYYTNAVQSLKMEVLKGIQLHKAMQSCSLFPLMMTQMIKIGEDSGALESLLQKIAMKYESDADHLISNLNSLLEPLIMLILGVLIGGLIISMYLPIFKLGTII